MTNQNTWQPGACTVAWQQWVSASVGAISGWGFVCQFSAAPTPPVTPAHFPSWPGPCSGDPGPYTVRHGSVSCSGWWGLPTSLFDALLLALTLHPLCLDTCLPPSSRSPLSLTQASTFQSISDAILGGRYLHDNSLPPVLSFPGTQHQYILVPSVWYLALAFVRSKSLRCTLRVVSIRSQDHTANI